MSRPIGEPSVPLSQARQAYGTRQLQRRPAQGGLSDFGGQTQEVFLPAFADITVADVGPTGCTWLGDAASYGGGYVTKATSPGDGDSVSFLSYFAPAGSIWSVRYLFYEGPGYGKLRTEIASVGYQLDTRPSGCPGGKIQPYDSAYGDALVYLDTGWLQDCYAAVEAQPVTSLPGNFQLVVGGNLGDPLTDLSDVGNPCADGSGQDPLTGFLVMDGGPGWYRTQFRVDGKNAASSGFRFRITRVAWSRIDDAGGI